MTSATPVESPRRDLFLVSILFLFLELVFIRWLPAQVLFLTFFTNTVLLASFLGLSLGCMAARSRKNFLPLTPLLLIVTIAGGGAMEWVRLALQDVIDVGGNKSSPQMVYFGAEAKVSDVASFIVPIEAVVGLFFVLIALTMIGAGQVLGRRFAAIPNPVQAYSINVGGSLAGILLFQLCSTSLSPVWWFSLTAAMLMYFLLQERPAKSWAMVLCCAAPVLVLAPEVFTMGVIREKFPVETWSPYYRINYSPAEKTIVVNLLGHQQMVSRNEPYPAYALPYLLNRDAGQKAFQDILIIGAGSGNDVSRALQWASADARIDAVEIDPVIQRLGIQDHPDKPYQDSRVTRRLGDGRNFLRSTKKKYDLIVFALIDSLVLHSSVSNIRLESYLFTEESMSDVQRCLKPDGLFVMYNYFRQGWIVSRLTQTVQDAFGQKPLVLTLPHQARIDADSKADGFTVLLAGGREPHIQRAFENAGAYKIRAGIPPDLASPDGFQMPKGPDQITFEPAIVDIPAGLRLAEDAWPFLYLRNPMIPDLSWRGIVVIGLLSMSLLWIFGWRPSVVSGIPLANARGSETPSGIPLANARGSETLILSRTLGRNRREGAVVRNYDGASRLNLAMLMLGAGFMLLETKAVVHMALVFGSTWMVNTVVFSAIMAMILCANLWVSKRSPSNLTLYYVALLATLALNVAVPLDSFLGMPHLVQAFAAGALVLCPVLCSGVVFAMLIRKAEHPEQAIAYNTAGAMLGGLAETASLLIGFKYLLLLAGLIYVGAWVFGSRERSYVSRALQTASGRL